MKGFFTTVVALLACLPLLGPVHTAGALDMTPEKAAYAKAQAEAGDAKAQNALGGMYYMGLGVPQDYAEARRWYGLAAAQGLAEAQLCLGLMCKEGQGGPREQKWWVPQAREVGFSDPWEAARGRGHVRPSASSLSSHGCEWAGVGGNRPALGVSSSHMPPLV